MMVKAAIVKRRYIKLHQIKTIYKEKTKPHRYIHKVHRLVKAATIKRRYINPIKDLD